LIIADDCSERVYERDPRDRSDDFLLSFLPALSSTVFSFSSYPQSIHLRLVTFFLQGSVTTARKGAIISMTLVCDNPLSLSLSLSACVFVCMYVYVVRGALPPTQGTTTAHALDAIQSRGTLFIAPGVDVYNGISLCSIALYSHCT
jgi:hypothetical protein